MDRTSEAIIKTEDLDLRVRELERALASSNKDDVSIPVAYSVGKVDGLSISFGKIKTNGRAAVIVVFDGNLTSLRFGPFTIATGKSPIFATISGTKVLSLSDHRTGARALVIGGSIVEESQ